MKRAAAAAHARRCAQHAGLPDRPDRRPARARRGQLARARRHPSRRSRRCWRDERAHPPARRAPRSPCWARRSPPTCSTFARPAARSSAPPAAARPCRAPPTPRCSGCRSRRSAWSGSSACSSTALARGEWARLSQATLALTALVFSAYLLYIQLAVIDAICQWCLATDVLTTAIAAARRCASGSARHPARRRDLGWRR